MNIIRIIRHIGILNLILLLVAVYGIMVFIGMIVSFQHTYTPTITDITDSMKEATSLETLTEKQLQEGSMIEGKILFNMGDFFTDNAEEYKEGCTHYAILLGDKIMSIAIHNTDPSYLLDIQATDYEFYLAHNGLNIWQYHAKNNSSKNEKKKNQKTVKQVIQEKMETEPGVTFKGKVVKMDAATEEALRNYVTSEGETEPVFEVVPYEIKSTGIDNVREFILAYVMVALSGIVGIGALCIYILRMRAHKYFP